MAVGVVFLLALALYRSIFLAFVSVIPLSMCVLLNFGIMGFFGIDLSIPMAMISSMIIGIGVDFSFHLVSRLKRELAVSEINTAINNSIKKVGEPILYSALTTACGGIVLMISSFVPVRFLGFLLALIMLVCALIALTILASTLTFTKPKHANK